MHAYSQLLQSVHLAGESQCRVPQSRVVLLDRFNPVCERFLLLPSVCLAISNTVQYQPKTSSQDVDHLERIHVVSLEE
jgi:hypothetical protein